MKTCIPDGVWPTMVTPFTETNEIDYSSLEKLIGWYAEHKVDGLFAVCQSSEMFFLTLDERVKLAAFVKEKASVYNIPVIASGHISDNLEEQVRELELIAGTGVDAVVLITNRLAQQDESDEIWLKNLKKLLKLLPEDIPLGFYECPFPYKRIISSDLLKWCAGTGRFFFLKDTSCDIENIRGKLEAVKGSGLKVYNANTATLLETLKLGVSGYSGVMANFHPELYVWLLMNWNSKYDKAKHLSNFLSISAQIERQFYPVSAKYFLGLENLLTNYNSRSKKIKDFTSANRIEVEQFREFSNIFSKEYKE